MTAQMHFLSIPLLKLARKMYAELDVSDHQASDRFFETFGPRNVYNFPDRPYERLRDYELLLKQLHDDNPEKYRLIHKGVPFIYMAWLAFDLRNYEKALFYVDAAISEDYRKSPDGWLNHPAMFLLTLEGLEYPVSQRTAALIRQRLNSQIYRFNIISGLPPLTLKNDTDDKDDFIDGFVRTLVKDAQHRTIVTALYVYLLEYYERYKELQLGSAAGGSIGPLISHLFRGGLIFESILKYLYPTKNDGRRVQTLDDIFKTEKFKNDFPFQIKMRANSLARIIRNASDDSNQCAFTTTAQLRNTTGHNLIWDDTFSTPEHYQRLVHQELNSVFYLIAIKFR